MNVKTSKAVCSTEEQTRRKFKKYPFRVGNENVGGALPVLNKIIRNCMQGHSN